MKNRKTPQPIETKTLCNFGCGQVAAFITSRGNVICDTSANRCPVLRAKNSNAAKNAHAEGRRKAWNDIPNLNRAWAKGLTKATDARILRIAESVSCALSGKPGRPHTEETKQKLRSARLAVIENGSYDSSGKKGHRGYYCDVYFHSSWELAFLIYEKEFLNIVWHRCQERIAYTSQGKSFTYISDFVNPRTGQIVEIKGYLYSTRDHDKYEATRRNIKYLFKDDLFEHIKYAQTKYGKTYWDHFTTRGC